MHKQTRSPRRGRICIGAINRPRSGSTAANVCNHYDSGYILHRVHPRDHYKASGQDTECKDWREEEADDE